MGNLLQARSIFTELLTKIYTTAKRQLQLNLTDPFQEVLSSPMVASLPPNVRVPAPSTSSTSEQSFAVSSPYATTSLKNVRIEEYSFIFEKWKT